MSLLLSSLYCMLLCIVILFTLEYHFCIWKYAKQCDRPLTRQKLTSFFHSMLFWVRNYSFASWENKFLVEYFIILWVPGVFFFLECLLSRIFLTQHISACLHLTTGVLTGHCRRAKHTDSRRKMNFGFFQTLFLDYNFHLYCQSLYLLSYY